MAPHVAAAVAAGTITIYSWKTEAEHSNSSNSSTKAVVNIQSNTKSEQFPWKLHAILHDAATGDNDAAISWLPGGRAFRVDKDLLEKTICKGLSMPTYCFLGPCCCRSRDLSSQNGEYSAYLFQADEVQVVSASAELVGFLSSQTRILQGSCIPRVFCRRQAMALPVHEENKDQGPERRCQKGGDIKILSNGELGKKGSVGSRFS